LYVKKYTANLKMMDKLIVSPDTSMLYGEMCCLTGLQNQEASGREAAIDCVLSVTG